MDPELRDGSKRRRLNDDTAGQEEVRIPLPAVRIPTLMQQRLPHQAIEEGEQKGAQTSGETELGASPSLHLPLVNDLQRQTSRCQNGKSRESEVENRRSLCVRGLPEWMDEAGLRATVIGAHDALVTAQTQFSIQQPCVVTNVHVVRDPETQQCVGYGYIELMDQHHAANLLRSQPLQLPNSNRLLSLSWAPSSFSSSPSLDNYHFYIGNIRPDLSDRSVSQLLGSLHPAVRSVRLVPQELLGPCPLYVGNRRGTSGTSVEEDLLYTASVNFYRVPNPPLKRTSLGQSQPSHAADTAIPAPASTELTSQSPENSRLSVPSEDLSATRKNASPKQGQQEQEGDTRRWGCGFIRLDEGAAEWKTVLSTLRRAVNAEIGHPLRRYVGTLQDEGNNNQRIHQSSLIMIRPIFDKFDDAETPYSSTTRFKGGLKVKRSHTANMGEPSKTTIFVGNLAEGTTEEDLNALFSPFGLVLSVRVAFLKHVGFVEMLDHRTALAALSHLTGAVVKKARLYFDWGRRRPAVTPRLIEIETHGERDRYLEEKTFARQSIQSLQPQQPTEEPAPQIESSTPSTSAPHQNLSQSFWLSSLCASLPARPSDKQQQEQKQEQEQE